MKVDDVKRLKKLERENQRLQPIAADQTLDIYMLKGVNRVNFTALLGVRLR